MGGNEVLALAARYPCRRVARDQTLITQGSTANPLFVLLEGSFEVLRDGHRVTRVQEPGSFLGEVVTLLGGSASATLVALQDSQVHVIDNAADELAQHPELTLAIARLLARRLVAMTSYLADLKRQYADSNSHLALMDKVLVELMGQTATEMKMGSERSDQPDY